MLSVCVYGADATRLISKERNLEHHWLQVLIDNRLSWCVFSRAEVYFYYCIKGSVEMFQ